MYASALLKRMQARLGILPGARKYMDILGLIQTFFHFTQREREFHIIIGFLEKKYPEMIRFPSSVLLEQFVIS
jgi:hypothetical protein